MDIKFFENFSKRINSTKQPDSSVSTWSTKVVLKDETSLYNPTFLMNTSLLKTFNYNYAQWDNRYYYVTDIVKPTISNTWEIVCTIDLLATYREYILNTKAFVKYHSTVRNDYIPDTRLSYPVVKDIKYEHQHLQSTNLAYSIVVQYISAKDSYYGSVAYAVLNTAQLQQLNAYLMSDSFQDSLDKQLDSTASAIVGCMLYPFTVTGDDSTSSMNIAGKDSGITASSLIKAKNIMRGTVKFTYPTYDNNFYDDYRDLSPYTSYILFLVAYGYVEIPAEYIVAHKGQTLDVDYFIDLYTGSITYQIDGIGKFDGSIAVNIPTAYSGINAINTINNSASTLGSVIGNLASGNIGGASTLALLV